MSVATSTPTVEIVRRSRPVAAFFDALTVTQRNLIAYRRVPQLLIFSTVQPVIFVLMFRYVFGGAIKGLPNGVSYVDYLIPGVIVQATVFGAIGTAIGLAADMKSGLLERFHSLPMARSALLAGRTISDLARNAFVVTLMLVVGIAVGFRVHTDLFGVLAGLLLVLSFSYALSWIFATVGLLVGDPETAQAAAFPLLIPLVFASSLFVPVETMPTWLQWFASHQPVSVTASAARALMVGGPASSYVWQSIGWIILIQAVCIPLAVGRYRKAV